MNSETISEALARASFCLKRAGIVQARQESEILLAAVLGIDRLKLLTQQEIVLPAAVLEAYRKALKRRSRLEPVAYITGIKHFFGRPFLVDKRVLIPRPETEFLINRVLQGVSEKGLLFGKNLNCVDLGTGSGIIAVTVACLIPSARVWAVDVSGDALAVAKHNALKHGVVENINFVHGDFLDAFDHCDLKPRFNLVAANPPYLSNADMVSLPPDVYDYEPQLALSGGVDGLDYYSKILNRISEYLLSPAVVLLEIGAGQREAVEKLMLKANIFDNIKVFSDYSGHDRIVEGVYIV